MKRLLLLTLAIWMCFASEGFSQKIVTTIQIGGVTGYPAVNTTTNMIYVPNTTTGMVAVINGQTNQIVANISVGTSPSAAAVNPNTNLIYVSGGQSSPYIAVIDGSSNTVTATVPVAFGGPMAVNIASNLIYFLSSGDDFSVLNGATNQVTDTVTITKNCCLRTIAYSPVTNHIYCTMIPNDLSIIDASTLKFTTLQFSQIIQLGGLALDSTSNRVYLSDAGETALYVVNGKTGKLNTSVLSGSGYGGPIAANPTNHLIADFGYSIQSPPFLSFISGRNYALVGNSVTFPTNSNPYTLVSGVGDRYYVTFYQRDGIAVVSGPKTVVPKNRASLSKK
jgi:YVTN family beta-propeller protein